ncbi:hypothetical protein C8R44DRAFT_985246 [Mycena epipterygia]|nr:hypothetical protein C8R44DRAFT_985246 [Mycena epipterygia]
MLMTLRLRVFFVPDHNMDVAVSSSAFQISPETRCVAELATALEAARRRIQDLENEAAHQNWSTVLTQNYGRVNDIMREQLANLHTTITQMDRGQIPAGNSVLQQELAALTQENAREKAANAELKATIEVLKVKLATGNGSSRAGEIAALVVNLDLEQRNKMLTVRCAELEGKLAASGHVGHADSDDLSRENTTTISLVNEDAINLFPSPAGRRSFRRLGPVCSALATSAELEAYLASKPALKGIANRALFLPGLTSWTSEDELHAVVYLPTASYEHHTGWTKRTGIRELDGKTELFMLRRYRSGAAEVFYAGTYQSHVLRSGGAISPEIVTAVWKDTAPNCDVEEAKAAFSAQFPGQPWNVYAIGLQAIGFNLPFYDALRKEYKSAQPSNVSSGLKRRAEEEIPEQSASVPKRARAFLTVEDGSEDDESSGEEEILQQGPPEYARAFHPGENESEDDAGGAPFFSSSSEE